VSGNAVIRFWAQTQCRGLGLRAFVTRVKLIAPISFTSGLHGIQRRAAVEPIFFDQLGLRQLGFGQCIVIFCSTEAHLEC